MSRSSRRRSRRMLDADRRTARRRRRCEPSCSVAGRSNPDSSSGRSVPAGRSCRRTACPRRAPGSPRSRPRRSPATRGRPAARSPASSCGSPRAGDDGVGDIEVSTPARFTGYLGDPQATAAAVTGDGWLRTGDLGRLDADGYLTVLDRRTDRIVRGGENISPAEVEAVLLAHPAIADAAVVARRDPTLGHVPVAAIVIRDGAVDPGDEALIAFCRERLAGYKVPVGLRPASRPCRGRRPASSGGPSCERCSTRSRRDPDDRVIERPDGVRLAERRFGQGPIHLLLLHGTLSTAGQLGRPAPVPWPRPAPTRSTPSTAVGAVEARWPTRRRSTSPSTSTTWSPSSTSRTHEAPSSSGSASVASSPSNSRPACRAGRWPWSPTSRRTDRSPTRGPGAPSRAWRPPRSVPIGPAGHPRRRRPSCAASRAAMPGIASRIGRGRSSRRRGQRLRRRRAARSRPGGPRRDQCPDHDPDRRRQRAVLPAHRRGPRRRIPGARHVRLPGMAHPSPITDPGPVAAAITRRPGCGRTSCPPEESRT